MTAPRVVDVTVLEYYRVFNYLPGARDGEPGSPTYVPPYNGGRMSNLALYRALYVSKTPEGAIAETFGDRPSWDDRMLRGTPRIPGSRRALALLYISTDRSLSNLDDPSRLMTLKTRPSEVVARNYDVTRALARRVYDEGIWAGVSWWSYHEPRYTSCAFFGTDLVRNTVVMDLAMTDAAIVDTAKVLNKIIA